MSSNWENVHFLSHVNIKNIIGKELINDDNVAVMELVKNSYDAGAKEVTVEFRHLKLDRENHEIKKINKKDAIVFKVNFNEREEYIKDIMILLENIEASDRYSFVNKLIKEPECIDLGIQKEHTKFKQYFDEIIKKRNILAHVKEDTIDGKKVLKSSFKGYEEFSFSHEDFKQIRRHLIEHKENINLMIKTIQNNL